MKIDELSVRWQSVPPAELSYQRVDGIHILDVYLGKNADGQKEFLIISQREPAKITSSRSIDIQKNKRTDNQWATVMRLLDTEQDEVFTHLCWDLIEHSRCASSKDGALDIVIARFLKWQKLMLGGSDLLTDEVIKGIIGELTYAKNFLKLTMTWDEIFASWLGPDGADKDFVFRDTWTEVKSIRPGKSTVTISSLEQLVDSNPGTLAVMYIDKTSSIDENGFSFASVINDMRKLLASSPNALLTFEAKLIEVGYVEKRAYYDKFYTFDGARFFDVVEGFPVLQLSTIPNGIVKVRYDISIPDIVSFESVV